MTRLIVTPEALDRAAGGGELAIEGDDHHYLARVLRLGPGADLEVIDGAGRRAAATIARIAEDRTAVVIDGAIESVSRTGPELVSVIALIKGERMDWAISKLVELGVDRIVPVRCRRSVVKVSGDRAVARRDRFDRLAESAARQCGRAELPIIEPIADFAEAIAGVEAAAKLVFTPLASRSIAGSLPTTCDSIALATGPEGGFTRGEIDAATAAGFSPTLLGPRVLRAETAAIAALAAASALRGELAEAASPRS